MPRLQRHLDLNEDFRTEILGFLGSSPNYLELYRKALVDRDYSRTEREIAQAIEKARESSEALRNLAQELEAFNLEHYRKLESEFTLDDLRTFFEKGLIRLGGAILPDGEAYRIETPPALRSYPSVSTRYDSVTFDRSVAMRKRKTELLGVGHPLLDALITHFKQPSWKGNAADLRRGNDPPSISVRWLITAELKDGKVRRIYLNARFDATKSVEWDPACADLDSLINLGDQRTKRHPFAQAIESMKSLAEASFNDWLSRTRAELDGVRGFRVEQVGLTLNWSRSAEWAGCDPPASPPQFRCHSPC